MFKGAKIHWSAYADADELKKFTKDIRSAEKRSQALFSKDAKQSSKPSISFTIMAIKLAFLLGVSWVIGYIGGLSKNIFLLYCFVCLNSFQGVFHFFAFCCNKRVFAFYRRILQKGKKKIGVSLTRMTTQESQIWWKSGNSRAIYNEPQHGASSDHEAVFARRSESRRR